MGTTGVGVLGVEAGFKVALVSLEAHVGLAPNMAAFPPTACVVSRSGARDGSEVAMAISALTAATPG